MRTTSPTVSSLILLGLTDPTVQAKNPDQIYNERTGRIEVLRPQLCWLCTQRSLHEFRARNLDAYRLGRVQHFLSLRRFRLSRKTDDDIFLRTHNDVEDASRRPLGMASSTFGLRISTSLRLTALSSSASTLHLRVAGVGCADVLPAFTEYTAALILNVGCPPDPRSFGFPLRGECFSWFSKFGRHSTLEP